MLHLPAFVNATRTFAVIFLAQAFMYAFHESAEAHLIPWSALLHAATEPYGPDGLYGQYVSHLLVALPVTVMLITLLRDSLSRRFPRIPATWIAGRRPAAAVTVLVGIAIFVLAGAGRGEIPVAIEEPMAATADLSLSTTGSRVMFRQTAIGANYGMLTTAALATPSAGRVSSPLACERVAFASGRGICLQADRGVFTKYKATLFDEGLKPRRTFDLDGSPSRARISSDGRVGAITVFVSAQHGYSASFSTQAMLIDMTSGDPLGDLEQFTTWRDGVRFQAKDFNFWGVTFARDSNAFYASLRTDGKTYLVRGDLGLRKLTVLRENVECPSLSPDNSKIVFKKRVGGDLRPWRLYVLDLATMQEQPIPGETRSVDDQIEWLDDRHVLYGMPRSSQSAVTDVWVSAIDGNEPARVFVSEAESPIVIR
jgi:hypothetical protein